MADFTHQESQMMGKYFGDGDLVENDLFWIDCLIAYPDKVIPLPLVDGPEARRKLADLLVCPPGGCGMCCRYERVPVSKEDMKRLSDFNPTVILDEKIGTYLACKDGCQFLNDNTCKVYGKRPDVCMQFPVQLPREGVIDGKIPFKQVQYRLKCEPGLKVVRAIMREAVEPGNMILLADLSLVPKVKAVIEVKGIKVTCPVMQVATESNHQNGK